jgi:LPXTG-motif cell wall-anchored protein
VEKYIWFSVYDSINKRTLAPAEYTCTGVITPAQENEQFIGDAYANCLVAISGQPMTQKIKQGWNVRFLNLPIGTTYSFEETNIPDGYIFVKAEVGGTRWIANMVNGEDKGHEEQMSGLPSKTSADNNGTGISGTIDFANACYSTTYRNKALTQWVNILKTSQNGTTPLPGAVFSLYTESGYADDPKQASKTGLTSGAGGKIDLGSLAYGKYYLVETSAPAGYILLSAPVVITVAASGVTYTQEGSTLPLNGNGISHVEGTDLYTLTVTNNAGVELPNTGGTGTRLLTLLGGILILGAGALLWRRRRWI